MRRGNILEGIKAGFQAYMQGRQFGAQMDTNKLQQEQMAMTQRMREQQYGDYMSPKEQAAFDLENKLGAQEALYTQQQPWREQEAMDAERRRRESLTWNISQGVDASGRSLTRSGGGMKPGDAAKFDERIIEIAASLEVDPATIPASVAQLASEALKEPGGWWNARALILTADMMTNSSYSDFLTTLRGVDETPTPEYSAIAGSMANAARSGATRDQIQSEILNPAYQEYINANPQVGTGNWLNQLGGMTKQLFMQKSPEEQAREWENVKSAPGRLLEGARGAWKAPKTPERIKYEESKRSKSKSNAG